MSFGVFCCGFVWFVVIHHKPHETTTKDPKRHQNHPKKDVYISYTHIFLWLIIVLPDLMEGAGKVSECIKTLRVIKHPIW